MTIANEIETNEDEIAEAAAIAAAVSYVLESKTRIPESKPLKRAEKRARRPESDLSEGGEFP